MFGTATVSLPLKFDDCSIPADVWGRRRTIHAVLLMHSIAAVANRYRSGYLRNIRLEDMDIIANAALTAGLADEEEVWGALCWARPTIDPSPLHLGGSVFPLRRARFFSV